MRVAAAAAAAAAAAPSPPSPGCPSRLLIWTTPTPYPSNGSFPPHGRPDCRLHRPTECDRNCRSQRHAILPEHLVQQLPEHLVQQLPLYSTDSILAASTLYIHFPPLPRAGDATATSVTGTRQTLPPPSHTLSPFPHSELLPALLVALAVPMCVLCTCKRSVSAKPPPLAQQQQSLHPSPWRRRRRKQDPGQRDGWRREKKNLPWWRSAGSSASP